MQHEESAVRESHSTLLYFSPEEEELPELLLFEEEAIRDSGWKRASQKGRHLWQRMRESYDQYSLDIFAPDRFLRRLRSFRKVTVLLNQPIDPAVVKARIKQILRDRSYHHLRWMIIDALLLPVALLAAPIPGPNVLGYYLLFRVFSHWKSYRSASKTALDDMDVCVSNRAQEVTRLVRAAKDIKSALLELRKKYGLRALQEQKFIPQEAVIKEVWSRLKRQLKVR